MRIFLLYIYIYIYIHAHTKINTYRCITTQGPQRWFVVGGMAVAYGFVVGGMAVAYRFVVGGMAVAYGLVFGDMALAYGFFIYGCMCVQTKTFDLSLGQKHQNSTHPASRT